MMTTSPTIRRVLLFVAAAAAALTGPLATTVKAFRIPGNVAIHRRQQRTVVTTSSSLQSTILEEIPETTTTTTTTTTVTRGEEDTKTRSSSTPQQRSDIAKKTWKTIALAPTPSSSSSTNKNIVNLQAESQIFRHALYDEFINTIQGTYFVNGLASCQVGDKLVHPFEAHGFIKSIVFDGCGNLELKGRLVETPITRKETQKQRIEARGVMSIYRSFDTLWGRIQNAMSSSERDTANLVANIWPPPPKLNDSPLPIEQRQQPPSLLIVCGDNGEPYAIDPASLTTLGKLVDIVPQVESYLQGKKCLAHTRYDPVHRRFVMCTNTMNIPAKGSNNPLDASVTMEFFEFDIDWNMVSSNSYETNRFIVFHDWQMTDDYYVIPMNPARIVGDGLFKFITGGTVGTDVFTMEENEPGKFLLLPRDSINGITKEVKSDRFFNCFHFGPTYQMTEDRNQLVIYGAVFDQYTFGGEMGFVGEMQDFDPISWGESTKAPPPRLDKFVIDTTSGLIVDKKRMDLNDIPVDMPCFAEDTQPMTVSYFLGAQRPEGWFPFRSVVKLELESGKTWNWQADDKEVVSEPMFIPRPEQIRENIEDGFVISIVHNAESKACRLVVWDGPSFEDGPIASIPLGDLMPWCVHGSWEANYIPS